MLRNGTVLGIGVNLSREPFLGMAHGVHGGPCRNPVRRHPGVECLARRVKIEAASELIHEADSGRSQVFSECPETREHPHDQNGSFDALRSLGAQIIAWILRRMAHFYHIEKRLRETKAGPALRQAVRAAESRVIQQRLHKAITCSR